MKVLLTGITGNLGYAVGQALVDRGVAMTAVVRDSATGDALDVPVSAVCVTDLTSDELIVESDVDCIVHCAGNVHFTDAGTTNTQMMETILRAAAAGGLPVYYVSTAFLWRGEGDETLPRNTYERDKVAAERRLRASGVPHTIFRPSVLVGDSVSGALRNWTGYYLLVDRFVAAARLAGVDGVVRFPALTGSADMVPVDQAARAIVDQVLAGRLAECVYLTNPDPPAAQWVLEETLRFFGVEERFSFGDELPVVPNEAERMLAATATHFAPYWALPATFPSSVCSENLVDREYLTRTLTVFAPVRSIQ